MRKTLFCLLLAALLVLGYQQVFVPAVAAGGATIAPLDSNWAASSGALATPLGKVIFNIPDNRDKMNVTYILQGANPSADYTVGFNIQSGTTNCSELPAAFGVLRSLCPSGTVGGILDTEGLYQVGTLSTDPDGDGDLHINLKGLPSGTYKVLFWAVPCSPPTNCGFFPQAATGSWGGGGSINPVLDFIEITIP